MAGQNEWRDKKAENRKAKFEIRRRNRVDLWGWFALLSAWLGMLFWLTPSLMRRKPVRSRQLEEGQHPARETA